LASSKYDPPSTSEGSLDPLGLYAIADSLAVQLVPGIRERQIHPRFLTAIAVSTALCSEFDDDEIAADGRSEPWQVFEWYVVEGLVRTHSDEQQLRGLPGREKAANAIRDDIPLSAERYLKTPNVFGFHGVYRLLSRTLEIEEHGQLGYAGYDLLTVWMQEQGLAGFIGTSPGPGRNWFKKLTDAIRDGLNNSAVSRKAGWSGWSFMHDHLSHLDIGRREGRKITQFLMEDNFRRAVLEFLISQDGKSIWTSTDPPSEREFHQALKKSAGPELRRILRAIETYEWFARLLQDAFDDCRYCLSTTTGKVSPTEFGRCRGVQVAHERARDLFTDLTGRLEPYGETARLQEQFADIAQKLPPDEWAECLMEHHRRIQAQKPPNGKAPWIERFDDGTYMIRPMYRVDSGGRHDREYVHAYRTTPLWSFATDLGLV